MKSEKFAAAAEKTRFPFAFRSFIRNFAADNLKTMMMKKKMMLCVVGAIMGAMAVNAQIQTNAGV